MTWSSGGSPTFNFSAYSPGGWPRPQQKPRDDAYTGPAEAWEGLRKFGLSRGGGPEFIVGGFCPAPSTPAREEIEIVPSNHYPNDEDVVEALKQIDGFLRAHPNVKGRVHYSPLSNSQIVQLVTEVPAITSMPS